MTDALSIGVLHLDIKHGRVAENREALVVHAMKAARRGAKIIVAPELAVSGYSFEARSEVAGCVETLDGATFERLSPVAKQYGAYICAGIAEHDPATGIYYNSALVVGPDGKTAAHHRKVVAAERRWACPGRAAPSGIFDTPWGRVGVIICADSYFGLLPRTLALEGVDLLLVLANWPSSGVDPRRVWRARALENGFGVVGCNRTGVDRIMDCRECRSYGLTPAGKVLLDQTCEASKVFMVDYPLVGGRLTSELRKSRMAARCPEDFAALYLDVNNLDDFGGFWGLPPAGPMDIHCVVPESPQSGFAALQSAVRECDDSAPAILILPRGMGPLLERQIKHLVDGRPMAIIAEWTGPDSRHPIYGFISSSQCVTLPAGKSAVTADFGPARLALVRPESLMHPEVAVTLSKQGCDLLVTASDRFDSDDRLLFTVKCLERAAIAVAAPAGAMVCEPPVGHAAWKEELLTGFGVCSARIDTATFRCKRFQDRVDMEALLRRATLLICAVIFASYLFTADMALAQHGEQAPATMETITVTAEKITEYVKNHPQEVSVLDQKEIRERNIMGVEEALGVMPGVDVYRSSGIGARISIRGSGKSGGVLVLLNGRPLNTSQYGNVDLSTLSIDTIKSITVFKPPVPVWLGAGASEGAISIITNDFTPAQKKSDPAPTRLRFAAGSYGLADTSASRRFSLENGNIMLTGSGSHRDGKRTNADKNSGAFSLHWDGEALNETRLETDGRFYSAEYGAPGPTDNPTPDARQKYQKGSLDTRLRGMIGERGDYAVNVYGDIIGLNDKSQSGATNSQDYIKLGIKPQTHFSDDTDQWGLRLGGILEQENVDETLSGAHHRVSSGLSVQYDRRWDPVTGTLGLRGDYTSDFGLNPGASTGLGYGLTEKMMARINAGYSVNVPTFSQLYQPSHGAIDQVRGNPDLNSEKVFSYDLGLEYRFKKDQVFQVSFFRADIRDLISFQRGTDLIYRPINIDTAYRQGIELTMKQGWENGLGVDLGCIWQDSENRQTGNKLPYSPREKVKTTVRYTIPEWLTRLETTLRYEAEQFSEAENNVQEKLNDYVTMDIKMTQPFTLLKMASEWYVQVDNLWNTGFEIHHGYPDDGVRFSSGINLMF